MYWVYTVQNLSRVRCTKCTRSMKFKIHPRIPVLEICLDRKKKLILPSKITRKKAPRILSTERGLNSMIFIVDRCSS